MGSRPNAYLMGACLMTDDELYRLLKPLDPHCGEPDFHAAADQLLQDHAEVVCDEAPAYFIGHVYVKRDWDDSDTPINVDELLEIDLATARLATLNSFNVDAGKLTETWQREGLDIPPEWQEFVLAVAEFLMSRKFSLYLVAAYL